MKDDLIRKEDDSFFCVFGVPSIILNQLNDYEYEVFYKGEKRIVFYTKDFGYGMAVKTAPNFKAYKIYCKNGISFSHCEHGPAFEIYNYENNNLDNVYYILNNRVIAKHTINISDYIHLKKILSEYKNYNLSYKKLC